MRDRWHTLGPWLCICKPLIPVSIMNGVRTACWQAHTGCGRTVDHSRRVIVWVSVEQLWSCLVCCYTWQVREINNRANIWAKIKTHQSLRWSFGKSYLCVIPLRKHFLTFSATINKQNKKINLLSLTTPDMEILVLAALRVCCNILLLLPIYFGPVPRDL